MSFNVRIKLLLHSPWLTNKNNSLLRYFLCTYQIAPTTNCHIELNSCFQWTEEFWWGRGVVIYRIDHWYKYIFFYNIKYLIYVYLYHIEEEVIIARRKQFSDHFSLSQLFIFTLMIYRNIHIYIYIWYMIYRNIGINMNISLDFMDLSFIHQCCCFAFIYKSC